MLRFGDRPRRAVEIDGIGPVNIAPMRALGWSPQVSFSDGLDALIEEQRFKAKGRNLEP